MTEISGTEKHVIENNNRPLFRATESGQVMKRSISTYDAAKGTSSSTMGFPICVVPEYVEPRYETAKIIAELLNEHGGNL